MPALRATVILGLSWRLAFDSRLIGPRDCRGLGAYLIVSRPGNTIVTIEMIATFYRTLELLEDHHGSPVFARQVVCHCQKPQLLVRVVWKLIGA